MAHACRVGIKRHSLGIPRRFAMAQLATPAGSERGSHTIKPDHGVVFVLRLVDQERVRQYRPVSGTHDTRASPDFVQRAGLAAYHPSASQALLVGVLALQAALDSRHRQPGDYWTELRMLLASGHPQHFDH